MPPKWKIEQHVTEPYESLVPVVYTEFSTFDSTVDGSPLPRGQVAAGVDLLISEPNTAEGGEDAVDVNVLRLLRALDPRDDIAWSRARKERLEKGGNLAWRVSLTILVFTPDPPEGD
ncbi:hypothetical protein [Microbacterium sp.]|uniref:hypothetical protein n=1 Tax=Microbacterium sp. TaxID=51671 RepID=UPI00391E042D